MVSSTIPVAAIDGLSSISNDIYKSKLSIGNDSQDKVSFDNLFKSGLKMLEETNKSQFAADEAALDYAMGYSDNIHDVQIAQEKAYVSLQYTVQVRNAVIEAYKEIKNMQI